MSNFVLGEQENELPSSSVLMDDKKKDKELSREQRDSQPHERLFIKFSRKLLDEVTSGVSSDVAQPRKPAKKRETLREMCEKEEDDQLETQWGKPEKSRKSMIYKEFEYDSANKDILVRRTMIYLHNKRIRLLEKEIKLIKDLKKRHENSPKFVPNPVHTIVRRNGSKRTKQLNRKPRPANKEFLQNQADS